MSAQHSTAQHSTAQHSTALKRLKLSSVIFALPLLALSACGGGSTPTAGPTGATGLSTLVLVSNEPIGANCAKGGSKITAGLDSNGNKILDLAEITSTQFVCNGAAGTNGAAGVNGAAGSAGLTTLVLVINEAAGANCPAGGKKVTAGPDSNKNNTLDLAEVTSTSFVCNGATGVNGATGATGVNGATGATGANGATGATGANGATGTTGANGATGTTGANGATGTTGANGATGATGANGATGAAGAMGANGLISLVAIVPEPAGLFCTYGGNKVSAGVDSNGNKILDAAEVTSSSYVCNGAPGAAGATGLTGATGATGPAGATGGVGPGGPGLNWVSVAASSVQAVSNTGYLANNAMTPVTITLPTAPAVGDIISVSGMGAAGWKIAQNAAQSVIVHNLANVPFMQTIPMPPLAWSKVASSADGSKLVAAAKTGEIYTSSDFGNTWFARTIPLVIGAPSETWSALASSADGTKLIAGSAYSVNSPGGHIYTSADSGVTWTLRATPVGNWVSVASSIDGVKLVAVTDQSTNGFGGGGIYTSIDSGLTWTLQAPPTLPLGSVGGAVVLFTSVASSADGTKLVAASRSFFVMGQLYTSIDSGVTWLAQASPLGEWAAVASSADGTKLVATMTGLFGLGNIYRSADSGLTWQISTPFTRYWNAIASSADGSHLVAVGTDTSYNSQIYTSIDSGLNWTAQNSQSLATPGELAAVATSSDGNKILATSLPSIYTGIGTAQLFMHRYSTSTGLMGSLSGAQYDSVDLQFVGNNTFMIRAYVGSLIAR